MDLYIIGNHSSMNSCNQVHTYEEVLPHSANLVATKNQFSDPPELWQASFQGQHQQIAVEFNVNESDAFAMEECPAYQAV